MGDQTNTVNDLGAQLKEQLHVEEEAWHGNQSEPKGPETLTPAESRANQSSGTQGTSRGGSDGNQQIVRMSTGTSSARSSFALDQADILANRKSLEAFHKAYCHQEDHGLRFKRSDTNTSGDGHDLNDVDFFTKYAHDVEVLVGLGLPRELCKEAWMLSVLPSECPAPVSMLSKLWNIQESAAESCMLSLAELGVLKVAHLPDGNIWGLPQDNFIRQVQNQAHNENCQVLFHKSLVVGYARDAWFHARKSGPAPSSLITDDAMLFSLFACDLLDDGYIITNLVYHLVGARLDTVVRALLLSPEWLEKKLLSSGAAPVISDFRRYLMMYRDEDVKSVLEALQLSLGALKNSIIPGLLKTQLAGRLMMAPLASRLPWMMKNPCFKADAKSQEIVPLPILNPCLDQAGGLQRLCLKGHTGAVVKMVLLPSGGEAVSASQDGTIRVWDLEIGNCVMTIDAHDGPITGLSVTSDTSLAVTSSKDGMIRAFALAEGTCLRTFGVSQHPLDHFVLDPFGRFVVTADVRGKLCLWDLVSTTTIHESTVGSQISCMALSPCTKYVAVGTVNGDVYGIDIETWKLVSSLHGHTGEISGLCVTQKLGKIVATSLDGDIKVWKRDGTSLLNINTGCSITCLHVTKAYDRAICGYDDGKAVVWDLTHGNCLKVLDGHNGPVTCTSMSYNEDTIITGSMDGTAIAWSADSGDITRVLEGHSSSILCLEMSRKGRFAVTGSGDGSLRVWDFNAVNSHIPHWHAGNIRDLCVGKNGIAVTAGDDCIASLWDSSVGEFLGELKRHNVSIRWCIASDDGSKILTASPNREINVWNVESQDWMYGLLPSAGSRVKSLSASDTLELAVICLFDSSVSLWNLISGECVWEIQKRGCMNRKQGHTSAVNNVLITHDGHYVITASKDTTVRIWDVENKTCKHVLKEHEDSVVGIELEPTQRTLLTYAIDHTLATWDFDTGEKTSRAKFRKPIARARVSKTGKLAVALSDGNINIITPDTGEVKEIRMHSSDITDLLFTEDGSILLSSSTDCSIKMVDLVEERILGVFIGDCPITSLALDAHTRHIIAGTDRGVVIFLDASSLLPC